MELTFRSANGIILVYSSMMGKFHAGSRTKNGVCGQVKRCGPLSTFTCSLRQTDCFFRVQLETLIEREWLPVVRYDTAHGFAHRDLMSRHGEVEKTPLFNQDTNDALTFAESDLKTNWLSYRNRFREERI